MFIHIGLRDKYWGVYNMLSMNMTAMVLKRLKLNCPPNRKIDAFMTKEKSFRIAAKSNK